MIELRPHAEGTVVAVRAQPGARRNAIVGVHAGALRVAVTAPPEQGKANAAIASTLAGALGLKPAQVSLVAGPASREKRFVIVGLSAEEVRARIAAILEQE